MTNQASLSRYQLVFTVRSAVCGFQNGELLVICEEEELEGDDEDRGPRRVRISPYILAISTEIIVIEIIGSNFVAFFEHDNVW